MTRDETNARLLELTAMEANWDSYGAPRIDSTAIFGAGFLCQTLRDAGWVVRTITPTTDAGIEIEAALLGIVVTSEIRAESQKVGPT